MLIWGYSSNIISWIFKFDAFASVFMLNHVRVIPLQPLAAETLTNENENTAYVHRKFHQHFRGNVSAQYSILAIELPKAFLLLEHLIRFKHTRPTSSYANPYTSYHVIRNSYLCSILSKNDNNFLDANCCVLFSFARILVQRKTNKSWFTVADSSEPDE